jgi:hypothetical protein
VIGPDSTPGAPNGQPRTGLRQPYPHLRVQPLPAPVPPAWGRGSHRSGVQRRGFTLDDFTDDDLSAEDHPWLDDLTRESATDFAAAQGYDLSDYVHGGCVAGWWGFTWMILAEARGVLTPEKRAAAWCRHGERTRWASKRVP